MFQNCFGFFSLQNFMEILTTYLDRVNYVVILLSFARIRGGMRDLLGELGGKFTPIPPLLGGECENPDSATQNSVSNCGGGYLEGKNISTKF